MLLFGVMNFGLKSSIINNYVNAILMNAQPLIVKASCGASPT